MKQFYFWQHQFTSEIIGNEETPSEVCCHCGKISQLIKKLLLLQLLDIILCKLDKQKNYCWAYLKKVRKPLRFPASWMSLSDTLQDTKECDWQTANIGETVFQISCFMQKSVGYYGPVR